MISAAARWERETPVADEGTAALPFDEVYRRLADPVYRFCLSQLGDVAAAEDVAAETFAAAFAAYDRTRPGEDGLRPWLFRIARNATVDHHRRAGGRLRLLGRLRSTAPDGDVEASAELRDELRAAVGAVARLGRRDRQLVGLRVAAGLSYAEIAAIAGMSEAAARTATHRALARVRAALEDHE